MRAEHRPAGPNLMDALSEFVSAELARRLRFLDADCERAWELTAPERRLHLVVVEMPVLSGTPPAVACSWPLPPSYARPVETISTGGFL